jgi:hypothetical protein
MPTAPAPLPENLPYAFAGETMDARLVVDARRANRWLAARNPTGRANADVLRETVGLSSGGRLRRRWIIDFPAELSPRERALYALPSAALRDLPQTTRATELRAALARLDRYLAAPAENALGFEWIESGLLPDSSLVVWARDDDFSAGILNSPLFGLWLDAQRGALLAALRSFPFPWKPGTPLGALNREQEEHRHAVAKAARAENVDDLNRTVLACYGWRDDGDAALFELLRILHGRRLSYNV